MLVSIKQEIKDTLTLSVPLVASQLIYATSGFVGTAMVARLGEDALAASVLVSTIWMSLSVLFFGLLNAVSILVSHQFGAKNNKAISDIMGQSFILGILVTLLIIGILSIMPVFLRFTAQPHTVIILATQYMHALLLTIPGLVILIILEQFLAGVNRTKLVLRISLLVVPIEIPLIYILIFGKFGLPAFGVAGIGYGFAITYSIVAIGLTYYLIKSSAYKHFAIFQHIVRINWRILYELIRIGLPMGFMHVIEVSTFAIATFWVAQFGTTMLAAHQIAFQFLGFIITIIFAMSQAVTVRVGHAVGEKSPEKINLAIIVGMILSFVLISFIALAFEFFPLYFLSFDINIHDPKNRELINHASTLLSISGILLLFDNFRIISFGALRGLKDTKFPMFASFIAFWIIGLSFTYLFGIIFDLGGKGIWWGLLVGIASGALLMLFRVKWLLSHSKTDAGANDKNDK